MVLIGIVIVKTYDKRRKNCSSKCTDKRTRTTDQILDKNKMKKETIMLIVNYKQQLAELENQFWFNNLDERFYKVNYDRIMSCIKELEND